jgi:hypothetical protein
MNNAKFDTVLQATYNCRVNKLWQINLRCEVITMILLKIHVCWIVMPCWLVNRYKHFKGSYCHHLQASTAKSLDHSAFIVKL